VTHSQKMVRYINTTPHAINVRTPMDTLIPIQPTPGILLRCTELSGGIGKPLPSMPVIFDDGSLGLVETGVSVEMYGKYSLDESGPDFEFQDEDIIIVSFLVGQSISTMSRDEFTRFFKGKNVRIISPGSGPDQHLLDDNGNIINTVRQCIRDYKGQIIETLMFKEYIPRRE